jgi:CBS domain-containing protein
MKAKDVMTSDVVTVAPETSISDAARTMLDHHISGLPVIHADGQLAGILTEGDLMRRAEMVTTQRPWWLTLVSTPEEQARAYTKAHGLTVKEVMTKNVATVDEADTLDAVAMLFEERGIKRAPVIRDGKIIGIVSRANLLQALAANKVGETGPNDEAIRSSILSTARKEAGIRISLVDVTVAHGVVHLWGNVGSEAERSALRVVAKNTVGVREVHDHLRLLPPSIVEREPE